MKEPTYREHPAQQGNGVVREWSHSLSYRVEYVLWVAGHYLKLSEAQRAYRSRYKESIALSQLWDKMDKCVRLGRAVKVDRGAYVHVDHQHLVALKERAVTRKQKLLVMRSKVQDQVHLWVDIGLEPGEVVLRKNLIQRIAKSLGLSTPDEMAAIAYGLKFETQYFPTLSRERYGTSVYYRKKTTAELAKPC